MQLDSTHGVTSDLTPTPGASPAPDWSVQTADILCPLCGYNLRGLTEGRCPECGYTFVWTQLVDRQRDRHPYLFEHHIDRPIWSFWKTLSGGLRPKKFWTLLNARHRVRPGLLFLFWWIAMAFIALVPAAAWLWQSAVEEYFLSMPPLYPAYATASRQYYFFRWPEWLSVTRWIAMTYAYWCLTTFLLLMIFQGSMRRAKVRTLHVVRCVLYSFDCIAWTALLVAVGAISDAALIHFRLWPAAAFFYYSIITAFCLLPIVITYRLYRAYKHYLHFDHPLATIIATQIIAALIAWIAVLNTRGVASILRW